VGIQTSAAVMENSMEVPQKIKTRATIWSRNPTPEYVAKGNEMSKQHLFVFICLIIHNSQ
jgi:hypothetical protein